jgi:hypothetical protein
MVRIQAVPPAEPRFYVTDKSGNTIGHIDKMAGGRFEYIPSSINSGHLSNTDLLEIALFLEAQNGRS